MRHRLRRSLFSLLLLLSAATVLLVTVAGVRAVPRGADWAQPEASPRFEAGSAASESRIRAAR